MKTVSLESESGFRALFEFATLSILVIDKDGKIELFNPSAERLFGYQSAELIGQPLEILIPENLRTNHVEHRNNYFTKPKARPMGHGLDLHARKKGGQVIPVEISLGYYELAGEMFAVAFVTDVTERKLAERKLLENKIKLDTETVGLKLLHEAGTRLWQIDELEQGLNEIVESTIALTKADKVNVQFFDENKMALQIIAHRGFEEEFLTYFKEVKDDDRSAYGKALKEKKQIIVEDTEKEWLAEPATIARNSGFRSVVSTPLIARDGSSLGMISAHYHKAYKPDELTLQRFALYAHKVQSFIERTRNYATIQTQNAALEQKVKDRTGELIISLTREKELNEMKSRFVSMASHEFRTPLSAILSSISLIDSYRLPEHSEKRAKHVERIKASVRNLTDIMNNFLSLDKLEQGKIETELTGFEIADFIDDIIEETRGMLEKKQQWIEFKRRERIYIFQDKKIIRNILLNLLSNAIKYSPEKTPVEVNIAQHGSVISIAVKDYGIGIPEEEQQNMFQNFFRAKNAANIQGSGLGLNIVKRYIELINGHIHFESKTGQGTTFTIEIPSNR